MNKPGTRTRPTPAPNPTAEELTRSLLEAAFGLSGRLEQALHEVGLSYAKYELLRQLTETVEPVPLCELASGRKCAASNITQLMDRLEADGLVRRVEDAADRRSKRAEITQVGRERQAAGARAIAKVKGDFAGSLSEADRRALLHALAAVK